MSKYTSFFLCLFVTGQLLAQQIEKPQVLNLETVIRLATDSSLSAFVAENTYFASYWEYQTYLAGKRPFLNLSSTPADFKRYVTQEFNFLDTAYQYVEQSTLNSSVNLSLNQNITATGGKVYVDSELARLENFNGSNPVQYSSIPVRIGLSQPVFGYNDFKWQRKIEPVKYEKAKKELIESLEEISIKAVTYFFDVARMQVNYEIAVTNLANADTLYSIGLKRFDIASISQEDLYTLNLEKINALNSYKEAKTSLKRAKLKLSSLLRLGNEFSFTLEIPDQIPNLELEPERCLVVALENNPEILSFRQQRLEAARRVDQIKKESRFNADLNASFGLNQRGNSIPGSYQNPLDQELVKLSLFIPILDWGVAKGKYNLEQRKMEAVEARVTQEAIDFEQDVIMTVEEFNIQDELVQGAAKADTIAQFAYDIAKQRFIIGKVDITKLNATHSASISAKTSYINALEEYWRYYYTIRKLTLYDFEHNTKLIQNFPYFEE